MENNSLTFNPQVFKWSQLEDEDLINFKIYREDLYGETNLGEYTRTLEYNVDLNRGRTSTITMKHGTLDNAIFDNKQLVYEKNTASRTKIRIPKEQLLSFKRSQISDLDRIDSVLDSWYASASDETSVHTTYDAFDHPVEVFHQIVFNSRSACPAVLRACNLMSGEQHTILPSVREFSNIIRYLFKSVTENKPDCMKIHSGLKRLKKLRMFSGKDPNDILVLIFGLITDVHEHGGGHLQVLKLISVIESCFHGPVKYAPPGFAVISPPGCGKTFMTTTCKIGFIDTDGLSSYIDKDPEIVTRLVNCGFSILTNRWEHSQWNCLKFYVLPKDIPARFRSKHWYTTAERPPFLRRYREQMKKYYATKIKENNRKRHEQKIVIDHMRYRFGAEEWFDKYKPSDDSNVIIINENQTVVDGYLTILSYFAAP